MEGVIFMSLRKYTLECIEEKYYDKEYKKFAENWISVIDQLARKAAYCDDEETKKQIIKRLIMEVKDL